LGCILSWGVAQALIGRPHEAFAFSKNLSIDTYAPQPHKALDEISSDELGLARVEHNEICWGVTELIKQR